MIQLITHLLERPGGTYGLSTDKIFSKGRRLSFGEYETKIIVSLRHPWALKDEITSEDMR